MQESLTPRERRQAQEVNALGLPVTIHLEDQLIPLPPPYPGPMEGGEVPEGSSSLWRSDTDGDLARWLNNGFTPRAAGTAAASLAAVVMRSTESNARCPFAYTCLVHWKELRARRQRKCAIKLPRLLVWFGQLSCSLVKLDRICCLFVCQDSNLCFKSQRHLVLTVTFTWAVGAQVLLKRSPWGSSEEATLAQYAASPSSTTSSVNCCTSYS